MEYSSTHKLPTYVRAYFFIWYLGQKWHFHWLFDIWWLADMALFVMKARPPIITPCLRWFRFRCWRLSDFDDITFFWYFSAWFITSRWCLRWKFRRSRLRSAISMPDIRAMSSIALRFRAYADAMMKYYVGYIRFADDDASQRCQILRHW